MLSVESRFRLAIGCLLTAIATSSATGQEIPFYYPPPAPGSVAVTRGIQFGRSDTLALRMDVFRPTNATGRMPVLVIFYGGVGASRVNGFSNGWGNAAASKGVIAVSPDMRH